MKNSNNSHINTTHKVNEGLPKTHTAITGKGSALTRYQDVVVGSRSLVYTIYYEWCIVLALIPGAFGILLRKFFWPPLFLSCGKGVVFGANIILRHPNRISIGKRVVISDNCTLDARNPATDRVIALGDDGILSDNVRISCKNGLVEIGHHFGIGVHTVIHSGKDEPVSIGTDAIIGPRCYITGGGNYNFDRTDIPIRLQGRKVMGGSTLENDVWLGAHVTVLGGVTMGTGSIAAAGAVVTRSIPPRGICMGIPATVTKIRGHNDI